MSTLATQHTATIADVYAAFGRGDIPAILDQLSDDVEWEHWDDHRAQAAGVPYLQARTGRDGAAEFFDVISAIEFHDFQVRGLAGGDDMVVADILLDATLPNGSHLRDEELHVWRFDEDGRICSLRHYVDTAKHIAANG
jgi:uncharacterized protein